MKQTRYTAEQILAKLREVERHVLNDGSVDDACRRVEISRATYYRWRKGYGGLDTERLDHVRRLEQENNRLRRSLAELHLEKALLE
ncbi:MAG: transposase, partial [Betaproteobacteria bacterium]|nr:transposase [Betaproteobacteria bacterium]